MKYFFFLSAIYCILVLVTGNALAFRCGNEIVNAGDSSASAQTKCGDPVRYGSGTEKIKGKTEYVTKEFYNCGENDFLYSVSIYNGIIVRIDSVERGTGKGQCQ
ncbi:MAG TPA: DUF2845 domain-containing protein [Smithella sp.]|nr:DUF2845 domain-containing protein [Smithella sp.]